MAKKEKQQKQCAVFTYDLFPYMVVHDVLKWDDEGRIHTFPNSLGIDPAALIAVFPRNMKRKIEKRLDAIEAEDRKVQKETRQRLLAELAEDFPALKRRK